MSNAKPTSRGWIWLLYQGLFFFGFLLLLPRFLWRMARRGGYLRDMTQRVGQYAPDVRRRLEQGPRTWVHAVSVGELQVALHWIERWRRRHPDARFVLSTTTSTGYALARRRLAPEDVLIYFPVDFVWVMRRVLERIRPRALVLVECELWPNLIRLAKARGLPVLLINGRISDSSFRGYRRLLPFTRRLLPLVDLLCVQTEADRQRLLELGAPPERTRVMGSAKYDMEPADPAAVERIGRELAAAGIGPDRLLFLGGSTWPGEEIALLDCFQSLRPRFPNLLLVLAPRHAERAAEVLREIERRGLSLLRRSGMERLPAGSPPPEVLLIDTTGELPAFYARASLIFVGKSLTQRGGQNPIEPALCGKPVLVGPHMENFQAVSEDFLAAGALVRVADAGALCREAERLLADPAARADLGERARRLVRDRAGAIEATLDLAEGTVGR